MKVRQAFVLAVILGFLLAMGSQVRAAELGGGSSSSRSKLDDLRDRRDSDSGGDYDDLHDEFRDIRRGTSSADRRSIGDRDSRRRTPTDRTKTTVPPPPPNRGATGKSSGRQPPARAQVGVIAGQKQPPGGPASEQPQGVPSSRPILYLEPSDMFVMEGEPFQVRLRFSNPTQELFDAMAVSLAYDPTKLELVDADPTTPEEELSSAWEALTERYGWLGETPSLYSESSDPEGGWIEVRFQTPEGKTDVLEGTLAEFRFVPLVSEGRASLSFVFQAEEEGEVLTFVRDDEEDILGSSYRDDDGVLDASFRISPGVQMVESVEELTGDYKTRIGFDPSFVEVDLGDSFDVEVVLENPAEVPFDTLSLVLGYDPRVLRAIDYDQNNWTKEGINIHDGDSVSLFPFTDRLINQVLLRQGIVLYRATSPHQPIEAEGRIATIRFTAVGTTDEDGMTLKIGFHRIKQHLNSGLFFRGRDVLAESEDPTDGFGTLRVFVRGHTVTRSRSVWDELRELY